MIKKLAGIFLLLFFVVFSLFKLSSREVVIEESEPLSIENLNEIPPAPSSDRYGIQIADHQIIESTIKRNESLYIILSRHGVSPDTIHQIQLAARDKVNLTRMVPGQSYNIYKNADDTVSSFVWRNAPTEYTAIHLGDEIQIEQNTIPVETRMSAVSGSINSSLAASIMEQGVSQRLVVELANIYAWTIDFYGLRKGDQYKILYENRYIEDEYIGIGKIEAVEFVHRGEVKKAYYFDNGEQGGYYDEEGNSLRRAMMRVPFEYNPRISSSFSHSRMHPILNTRRPHYGTDYAAPTGTPILAAGDGVVTEAQYRGGNGNIVQIKHNSVYRTAYLHMSRFAPGIRPGVNVKQGQVIGYVGQTGLATGPHLCYRLYKNDTPVNSVTYDFPAHEGISDEHIADFLAEVERLDRMMDQILVTESDDLVLNF
ncbi:MAG TPA: peptidoglycan DD-metalloendopeptidase family protein [Balneolaceae bacterium]|nr:peptidoglycan DD-metalloendopeptidase family protein [Balneolaceae bacterium]